MNFPEVESGTGGKDIVKLKGGDVIAGIFKGNPHIFRQHWENGRSQTCAGQDVCDRCKAGDKPKFRFAINFVIKDGNGYVAKVFEQSYGTYLDMKELHKEYNLEKTVVQIKRMGDDKNNTRYTILPLKSQPKDFSIFDKVPLIDVKAKVNGTGESSASGSEMNDDDIPF